MTFPRRGLDAVYTATTQPSPRLSAGSAAHWRACQEGRLATLRSSNGLLAPLGRRPDKTTASIFLSDRVDRDTLLDRQPSPAYLEGAPTMIRPPNSGHRPRLAICR
jgi:hypothetical protein